jgi:predicted transcriptional regulator
VARRFPYIEELLGRTMADPVTLHIEPSTIGAIDELARKANQPRDVLVEEALQNFVKLRAWQIAKIEEGIAAADRGEFVSDEEMDRIFSKYDSA